MSVLVIVIVSHNTRNDLENCLQSLHDHPPHMPHEIVVVDNHSTDGSAQAARRWADVTVIESTENLGFARANNIAIRASSGPLILLLNSDTVVPAGAINRLVAELRARPDAAIAGPRLVDGSGRAELSFGPALGPFSELRQKMLFRGQVKGLPIISPFVERITRRQREPGWVTGACLLVRRADAEAVGLLDERYFMYVEDVDFCTAIRAKGRAILFVPAVEIVHLRGRSAASVPAQTRRAYYRSQLAFYEKHRLAWAPLLRLFRQLRGQL